MESDMDWPKVIPLNVAYCIGKLNTVKPVYNNPQKVAVVLQVREIFFSSFSWVGDSGWLLLIADRVLHRFDCSLFKITIKRKRKTNEKFDLRQYSYQKLLQILIKAF
jgi:hypothetical protein